jgi:membrane fusion protein (multidrug efflux system)
MNAPPEIYTATDKIINKVTTWAAALILIVLLVLGGQYLWRYFRYEETNDAQVQEYINPVVSRVNGYIVQIKYEENQYVKKGDTLVLIDKSQYQLNRKESEDAVANARAQVEVLRSTIHTYMQTASVSKAQIEAAHAKLINEGQEFKRYKKLFDEESATEQQLENREAALDVARAEYFSSLGNYREALSRVNDVKKQEAVLVAEISRRETLLGSASLDLSYTVITAPYNGKMGKKTIQTGQYIQANQSLAFIVNEDAGKWVVANFKETQVGKMYIGQAVEIETDAFPGQLFHGKIQSLSPATGSSFSVLPPDNSTGNFVKVVQRIPVRIEIIDNRALVDKLEGGMNATVLVKKQ